VGQNVKEYCPVVTNTATEHEHVPDGMTVRNPLGGKKEYPYGVEKPAT
jgi:hypothetical protein